MAQAMTIHSQARTLKIARSREGARHNRLIPGGASAACNLYARPEFSLAVITPLSTTLLAGA
jgi:hypothetical protein